MYQTSPEKWAWHCTEPHNSPVEMWNITAHIHFQHKLTYHSWYCSRLGGTQRLDHLEHVHYSLCLTAINHSGQGTEHTTTSHRVTENAICFISSLYVIVHYLQWTNMGLLPVLLWTLATSSITSTTAFRLEHRPSGAQQVMWNWVTWCAFWDWGRFFWWKIYTPVRNDQHTLLWKTLIVLIMNPSRGSSLIRSIVYSPNSAKWPIVGQYWQLLSCKRRKKEWMLQYLKKNQESVY